MTDIHVATIPKNASEEIRTSLTEYNGHQLFNARVFFKADDGSMRPGKSGIAFRIDKLPLFADAVAAALATAIREGLIDEQGR